MLPEVIELAKQAMARYASSMSKSAKNVDELHVDETHMKYSINALVEDIRIVVHSVSSKGGDIIETETQLVCKPKDESTFLCSSDV
jgi:hypothetical protein